MALPGCIMALAHRKRIASNLEMQRLTLLELLLVKKKKRKTKKDLEREQEGIEA
jgi:hypothetical protein